MKECQGALKGREGAGGSAWDTVARADGTGVKAIFYPEYAVSGVDNPPRGGGKETFADSHNIISFQMIWRR